MHTVYFVLPADRHLPSGGNIYNAQLIEALQAAGCAVSVLSFQDYRLALEQDSEGWYLVDSLFIRQMQPLLHQTPAQTKSLFILHHLDSLYPPAGKTSGQIFEEEEKAVLQFFDGFLVTSAYTRQYLQHQGFTQPILLVEPATDLVTSSTSVASNSSAGLQALMVANLVERKGILPLLEHLQSSVWPSDDFVLTIVGRDDIEPAYARACQAIGNQPAMLSQKIRWAGTVPHAAMPDYYRQAHVLLSAAYMETFGMAIQEALAYRLPVLAIAGGHTAQHIRNGENGKIFNSTAEMAYFFIDLVRNRKLLTELCGKRTSEPPVFYSWQQAAASFVQQFDAYF